MQIALNGKYNKKIAWMIVISMLLGMFTVIAPTSVFADTAAFSEAFDSYTAGDLTGQGSWAMETGSNSAAPMVTNIVYGKTSSQSLQLGSMTNQIKWVKSVVLTAGKTYELRASGVSAAASATYPKISLRKYTSDTASTKIVELQTTAAVATVTSADFQAFTYISPTYTSAQFTVPALTETEILKLVIYKAAGAGIAYIDDIEIVEIDTSTPPTTPAVSPTSAASPTPTVTNGLGNTYYVDSVAGNDTNAGTSESIAWKTLDKVNATTFQPGDRILFKAGSIWNGQLYPKGSGEAGKPIEIDQYGTGPKPLVAGGGSIKQAVYLYNQQYWIIKNLEITNTTANPPEGTIRQGVNIVAEDFGIVNQIHLINLDIHHVNGYVGDLASAESGGKDNAGIYCQIKGSITPTKFDDLRIEGCHVYDIDIIGIATTSSWSVMDRGATWYPSTNVVIRNNIIERAAKNGVIIRACDSAVFEYNILKENSCKGSGNAMYPFNSDNTIVRFNESYLTRFQPGDVDSSGFDCDYMCNGTKMQYNYSHDNDGGFMVVCCSAGEGNYNRGNIIRYNISQNDKGEVIRLTGLVTDTQIYNNTIYVGAGNSSMIVRYYTAGAASNAPTNTNFFNNLFVNHGTGGYGGLASGFNTVFDYNVFYGNHPSSEPTDAHKLTTDPLLVNPGWAGIGIGNIGDMYKLRAGSPCIDSGVDVANNGGRDFFGNPLYNGLPDRGAHEYIVWGPEPEDKGPAPTPTPTPTPTPIPAGDNTSIFYVSEDTFVRNGDYAETNYNDFKADNVNVVVVKGSNSNGFVRMSYMKIDLTNYEEEACSDAELKFEVKMVEAAGIIPVRVYAVSDHSWNETNMNWNNRPASSTETYLGTVNIGVADTKIGNRWYGFKLTDYVNKQLAAGNKAISLRLACDGPDMVNSQVQIYCKETGGEYRPYLEVKSGKFLSTEDTFARSGAYSDQNFNGFTNAGLNVMVVKGSNMADNFRVAYVKMDLSGYESNALSRASLNFKVKGVGLAGVIPLKIYGVTDNTWQESTLTWTYRPADSTEILLGTLNVGQSSSTTSNKWYSYDVTQYVNEQLGSGNKTVSFRLADDGADKVNNELQIYTREAGVGNEPYLYVAGGAPFSVINSLSIAGDDSIVMYNGDGSKEVAYTAAVYDQTGNVLSNESVTWSVYSGSSGNPPAGISMNSSGVLTIKAAASSGTFTVMVVSNTDHNVKAVKNVTLEKLYKFTKNVVFSVGGAVYASALEANKDLEAKVAVTNNMSAAQQVLIIAALYDEGDAMVNYSYTSRNVAAGSTEVMYAGFKLPSVIAEYKVRVFVWDGTSIKESTMNPLSQVEVLQ